MSHAVGCLCNYSCQAAKGGLNFAKQWLNLTSKNNAQAGLSCATLMDDTVAKEYAFEVSRSASF